MFLHLVQTALFLTFNPSYAMIKVIYYESFIGSENENG